MISLLILGICLSAGIVASLFVAGHAGWWLAAGFGLAVSLGVLAIIVFAVLPIEEVLFGKGRSSGGS